MSASQRKDAAEQNIVPANDPVMKTINGMNSPYSVQATGLDKISEIDKTKPIDDIVPGDECLEGNRRGIVKTVSDDGEETPAVTEIVVLFKNETGSGPQSETTYSRSEIENSTIVFFKTQLPEDINV